MTPQPLLLAAGFSVLLVVGSSSGQPSDFYLQTAMSSSNVAPAEAPPHFVAGPIIGAEVATAGASTAQLLVEAHEESGLTWDQIARYFGVSRRAVHLWASGGRMSASNEELLAHLVQAVQSVRHLDPAGRRQALLRTAAGLNIIDTERSRRSSRHIDINRSPEIGAASDQA